MVSQLAIHLNSVLAQKLHYGLLSLRLEFVADSQPAYNVTPFAAIGLAAGSLFGISISAAAVPIVALVLSNMALPGYGSL